MSLVAAVMQSLRFTEKQNEIILSGKISADRMALMFKRPKRQIQRQRALLKKLEQEKDQ